jgi:hypothetical protein
MTHIIALYCIVKLRHYGITLTALCIKVLDFERRNVSLSVSVNARLGTSHDQHFSRPALPMALHNRRGHETCAGMPFVRDAILVKVKHRVFVELILEVGRTVKISRLHLQILWSLVYTNGEWRRNYSS